MLEFDIAHLAKLAHAKGAKVVVDNTFYSPIYQHPIEEGADIVLHSATKYLAGHNDVLAGVVVTNDEDLYDKLFYNLNTTGAVLFPIWQLSVDPWSQDASIRMERSTENARKVVEFLKTSPQVKEVLYTGKGGMVSFKIQDEKKIPNFLNSSSLYLCRKSWRSWKLDHLSYHCDSCGHSCRSSPFIWFDRWLSSFVHRNRRCGWFDWRFETSIEA